MASFLSLFFLLLSLTLSSSTQIQQACKATRFPQQCQASLTQSIRLPPNATPLQIIQSAITATFDNLSTAQSLVKFILDSSAGNQNRSTAANTCLEVLHYSEYRLNLANKALPRGSTKDARTWMTAAMSHQSECWHNLKYVNDTRQVVDTMSFLDSLIGLSDNVLSMMVSYDLFGKNDTASWQPPKTERDGFWEVPTGSGSGSVSGFKGGFPTRLTVDVTVCKDVANCDHKTIQEAVNAAPANAGTKRFVVHIKGGVYEEMVRIPIEKRNVVFLGDGMGKTVITGSANAGQPGVTTFKSATVAVMGDGFMAKDITFKNTDGTHQAVAFRSSSDKSVIENCEFLGYQDTLYVYSLRQFYKSCRIVGNVDFIFGNGASVFQDCQILSCPRFENPEKGESNTVTAQSRSDPAQATGFVFHNCSFNGTEEYMRLYHSNPQVHKTFLGRPWRAYARTVMIHCFFEAVVQPEGWSPWSDDSALKTLYYGEFENSGPGSSLTKRVPWSSKIPAEHVNAYSVQNFIQGDGWIPSS